MDYSKLSKQELLDILHFARIDRSFGIIKKEFGIIEYGNVADGSIVIYLDLANVHAANHKYSMDGYDKFVQNVMNELRESDILIKFAGDEIVILPKNINNAADLKTYIMRLSKLLADNNIYAVIAITTAVNGLENTVLYLDKIVSCKKLELEVCGLKPHRDAEYVCLNSIVMYV